MTIEKTCALTCPIDKAPLERRDKQMICKNGHTFDIARQGYVNLLPVQHKRSKHPGDSKEMVSARTNFLNSSVYHPIAYKLAELVFSQTVDKMATCFMDAGCGEGYYSDHVFSHIKSKDLHKDIFFIGLDISKPAIVEATKRNRQITWVVGTNRHPPVEANSIDVILCVFGFQSFEGFNNALKLGGIIILVEPGPDHLKELRDIIYTEVKQTPPQDLSKAKAMGFLIESSEPLQFETGPLNNEKINQLLLMTPHFYRATKEGKEAASKLNELNLTIDVVFRTLRKQ